MRLLRQKVMSDRQSGSRGGSIVHQCTSAPEHQTGDLVTGGLVTYTKAQVSLEMSVAVMCFIVLLFGILQVFSWLNSSLVSRQVNYESTRYSATSSYSYQAPPQTERLNIFGESR